MDIIKYIHLTARTTTEFTDKIYTFENWEPEQFYRDINEATIPYVRKSEDVRTAVGGRERYITYVMPIGPNPSDSFGTVIYLINETVLRN